MLLECELCSQWNVVVVGEECCWNDGCCGMPLSYWERNVLVLGVGGMLATNAVLDLLSNCIPRRWCAVEWSREVVGAIL